MSSERLHVMTDAWLGWAWLGCGNFPFRPAELDVDYVDYVDYVEHRWGPAAQSRVRTVRVCM